MTTACGYEGVNQEGEEEEEEVANGSGPGPQTPS